MVIERKNHKTARVWVIDYGLLKVSGSMHWHPRDKYSTAVLFVLVVDTILLLLLVKSDGKKRPSNKIYIYNHVQKLFTLSETYLGFVCDSTWLFQILGGYILSKSETERTINQWNAYITAAQS